MHFLESALAFAITMLFFSMLVTTLVETFHRIIGIRQTGLSIMLETVFDKVIWPGVEQAIGAASKDAERAKFVEKLTLNSIVGSARVGFLGRLTGSNRLSALSTLQFIQRLPDTDAGKKLIQQARTKGRKAFDATANDIARRFEELGAMP